MNLSKKIWVFLNNRKGVLYDIHSYSSWMVMRYMADGMPKQEADRAYLSLVSGCLGDLVREKLGLAPKTRKE
jgi:hypothetical protein